ncbi:arginase [Limnobacter sp.]|uniref:arginase n=1 Tax=Limnobacter sp. TaxID=2003368 RepID=UPI003519C006
MKFAFNAKLSQSFSAGHFTDRPVFPPKFYPPTLQLIGAPTDVGTTASGACSGPMALRQAGLVKGLLATGRPVLDAGDVQGPQGFDHKAHAGYRNLFEVARWNRLVDQAVWQALQCNRVPVLLGGDHCLAVGSISAVVRHCRQRDRRLRVLWFDAHADFNTARTSPSGNLHGMPLACLVGLGPDSLVRLSGHQPALKPRQVRLLGVRSVDPDESSALSDAGVPVLHMQAMAGMALSDIMAFALEGTAVGDHVHVSFDVDCLDPTEAPAVGTPVADGVPVQQLRACFEYLAKTGLVHSVDVMELNPQYDTRQQTTQTVLELLKTLLAGPVAK